MRGLIGRYDGALFDLDGVVYLGTEPIAGAAEAIGVLREAGAAVSYVTNNASRRPAEVGGLLRELGVPAKDEQIVTSAQVSAAVLADRLAAGAPVLVVGAAALAAEVAAVGLTPVRRAADRPVAVVQGYGPDVGWPELAEAAVAVRADALWMATNLDRTLPSPRGPLPGNGALVAALATALDRQPDVVVGKPAPTLLREAAARLGAHRPLMVGDRLDTDVEGAIAAGYDSALVLTGVSRPRDVLAVPLAARPTYLLRDLGGLLDVPADVRVSDGAARCGGWTATVAGSAAHLSGTGEPLDALRALAALDLCPKAVDADGGVLAALDLEQVP